MPTYSHLFLFGSQSGNTMMARIPLELSEAENPHVTFTDAVVTREENPAGYMTNQVGSQDWYLSGSFSGGGGGYAN